MFQSKFQKKRANKKRILVAVVLIAGMFVLGGCSLPAGKPAQSGTAAASVPAAEIGKPEPSAAAQDLLIPVAGITDQPAFYPYTANGRDMEILAVTASDGTVRTAFNTCQVCYGSGRGYYKVDGEELVCQNCGNRFGFDQVALKQGGCNPVPIAEEDRSEVDGNIVISASYLNTASVLFENWK